MGIEFQEQKAVEIYAEGVTAEELTLRPMILKMVGKVRGQNVLDIGCGDGRYSELFARSGANVIATDLAAPQIEMAQKKHAHQNIRYSVGDVSAAGAEPGSMDLVVANMVVPSIGSVEKLDELFAQARNMLRPDGRFVVSVLHPLILSPNQDDSDRPVNFDPANYFNESSPYRSEARTNAGNTMVFNESHFSLTKLSDLMQKNGFLIKSMVESKQVPEKGMLLPKYLAFECVPEKQIKN